MDRSTPRFSVLHYLPEFAQIHVHWVGDAVLCSFYDTRVSESTGGNEAEKYTQGIPYKNNP